jgi:hypothetical protein
MATSKITQKHRSAVMLSTTEIDLGLVNSVCAKRLAKAEADQLGVTVYIRDATTDEVVEVIEPSSRRERSNG